MLVRKTSKRGQQAEKLDELIPAEAAPDARRDEHAHEDYRGPAYDKPRANGWGVLLPEVLDRRDDLGDNGDAIGDPEKGGTP